MSLEEEQEYNNDKDALKWKLGHLDNYNWEWENQVVTEKI